MCKIAKRWREEGYDGLKSKSSYKIMYNIILIIIVLAILGFIMEHFDEIMGLVILGVIIFLCFKFKRVMIPIVLLVMLGIIVSSLYKKSKLIYEKNKRIQKNKLWIEENKATYTIQQIDDIICPQIQQILSCDNNKREYIFDMDDMPYGRANAFLNYFNKTIYDEEPYYFSCIPSMNDNEFREYGMLITRYGIYVSKQFRKENKELGVSLYSLEFSGLKRVSLSGNKIVGFNISKGDYDDSKCILELPQNIEDKQSILHLCQSIIKQKVGAAIFRNQIVDIVDVENTIGEAEKNLNGNLNQKNMSISFDAAAMKASSVNNKTMFNETKGYMNGSRGGGYAAEYVNNTFDRLKGMNVESTAQVLDEHGRQVKHGADRTVQNIEIQTKYYKTASESIGAVFENKQAIYIGSDGRMMQIEVPRDQYNEAVRLMQNRIDKGQVPNVAPGEDARNYVRKGYFTYAQAWNVTKAGTVESLTVDSISGAICTSEAAGITAVLMFAQAIWNGYNLEDAARTSFAIGLKILGKGTFIYTMTMQLSRKEFANPILREYMKNGEYRGVSGIANPLYTLNENIANSISKSQIAKTSIGRMAGLDKMTGQGLLSNSVTAVVLFGPDICKALTGRISVDQLIKNSVVGGSGIAGAAIGNIILPGLGGLVGGAVGGILAKNIMDNFVEDDAKKMFRILKEEFLDEIMLAGLNKEEFNEVVDITINNPKLYDILQSMYASGEYRRYARITIVQTAIIQVFSKRKTITENEYNQGIMAVLTSEA